LSIFIYQGHYLNAQSHHPQRWHPDQQMQNMEHTTQTSTMQVRQYQPMRKQTYKTPLTKQDINENRQSISAPPYRTGMLIGDTSRQHYSRERTHAGHKKLMFVLYVPYFAFVDQDAISVGDGFEHLNSGLGLLVVLI
jgi:hypothetical protein